MGGEQDSGRGDLDLLVRAAESYYIENKTQSQIATQLGISASTVSRLLSRARDEGIVRIQIIRPHGRHAALEQTLRLRYQLVDAVVASVPTGDSDEEALRRILGIVAAPAVDALIAPSITVGIGRGRSVAALADALQAVATPRHITLVQVMGEYGSQQSPARSAELTRLMAEMYAGTSYFLNAPALVADSALAELLLSTPGVHQIVPWYDQLDMMIVGVGPLRGSPLEQDGLIRADQIDALDAAGALGDICGHFVEAHGVFIDDVYSGRAIGISAEQLRRCPCVVVVAAGPSKVPMIRALLDARLIHVLVTDERTAFQVVNGR